MRIDQSRCVACGNCIPVCPMGAIYIDPTLGRAQVNLDECVECHACYRGMSKEHLPPAVVRAVRRVARALRFRFDPEPDVCPTDALAPEDLAWPRIVRRAFSDPLVPCFFVDGFPLRGIGGSRLIWRRSPKRVSRSCPFRRSWPRCATAVRCPIAPSVSASTTPISRSTSTLGRACAMPGIRSPCSSPPTRSTRSSTPI